MASEHLVLNGICKEYHQANGTDPVLNDISLTAVPGETIAIVGPSGSGKSTLLNIIGTLDHPSAGSVSLGDTVVTALHDQALAAFRATRIGFVFQDHHLLPQLTALENVLLPTLAARNTKQADARARALLTRVGVLSRADAFPAQMSGGERQRVAVARALINGADVLLCDEPTGNLDRETGAGVVELFLELARQDGVIVLMVTHNHALAGRFSRCLELRDGQLYPLDATVTGGQA